MSITISHTQPVKALLAEASGLTVEPGNPRLKAIVHRILREAVNIIEQENISPEEFWKGVNYFNALGARQEAGLLAAGLGLEHYLDLLLDAQDAQAGFSGGTPRTIEGPLYVANAPLVEEGSEARLDDGQDAGVPLFMQGHVRGADGQPLAGALVDVWHANTGGTYSYFDPGQSPFNLRRRIVTDAEGRFRFRSIVPSGYGCPPDGPTQQLLDQIGRHGQRPAHIHFFISAPDHRHLTTQINLDGDPYLHDDFAYATRDELIASITFSDDAARAAQHGVQGRFAEILFDFTLQPSADPVEQVRKSRLRVMEG